MSSRRTVRCAGHRQGGIWILKAQRFLLAALYNHDKQIKLMDLNRASVRLPGTQVEIHNIGSLNKTYLENAFLSQVLNVICLVG